MTTIKKTTPKKRSSTLADKKTKTGRAKTPTHGRASEVSGRAVRVKVAATITSAPKKNYMTGEEFAKSDMVGLWANHGIVGTSTDYVNEIRQKEQVRRSK
jgi:hypothetical protein